MRETIIMLPINPMRRLNTAIIRQQSTTIKFTPKKEILMDLIHLKIQSDPVDKDKWNDIRKEIVFSPNFSEERIAELVKQLMPDAQKSHQHVAIDYEKKFNDLSKQYQENLDLRKNYRDSPRSGKLAEIDANRSIILSKMVENLQKQQYFYSLAIGLEESNKGMVNIKNISEFKEKLASINKKLVSLNTKQTQYANKKELSPSNEAIKNFDRQNKEVINKLLLIIPPDFQEEFLSETSFDPIIDGKIANLESNPPIIQKNLADASKEILKFLDNTVVEEDLHKELDKLISMLGSKSTSANIKIVNNIEKIRVRLGILDSLRDLKEIIQNGKMDAEGAKILGYMLMATTSYKVHDLAFITRTLAVFTEYMKNNPVKTVTGSLVFYMLAIFLSQLFVLNELEKIKDTQDNANINDLSIQVCEVWLQAVKELGIDLSSTNSEMLMDEFKNSHKKVTNALSEVKNIEDAGDMKKQKEISEKQFNKLTPEEKELLYKQDTALNKLDTGYYEHKTLEKIQVNDSIFTQAVYKTIRDGLAPVIGDKMPEFINGVKEAAVICNTIRHYVNVANAEIEKNRPRIEAMRDALIQRVQDHIDEKIKENRNQGAWSKIIQGPIDIQKLKNIQMSAVNKVGVLTKECEAKLQRNQKLPIVGPLKEDVLKHNVRHLKPITSSTPDMSGKEEIENEQMKEMGKQISEGSGNTE